MPKPQYTQKFRAAWLKDPILKNWLQEINSTEGSVAKCKLCNCRLANKYADLKNHAETKKHKSNANLILGQTQPKIPFVKENSLTSAKIAECRLSLFVACHTPILTVDHLVRVCKNSFEGDAAVYLQMHRTKCAALIKNVIGPYFMNLLKEDIGDGPFSLLIDESTDIAVLKYMGASVIYFSKEMSKIVTTSLGLWELQSGDAQGITDSILKMLTKFNLRIANLQGLGTDNASVMVGINNGVYQKLKAFCPNLILIRCICHSLQLAVSAASKELPRNLDFLIRETYDWFARSSSRKLAYKTLYETINDGQEPLKITQACATRWLSIECAVSRIYSQWLELKTHFQVARFQEKCYSAELLYQMFCDEANYAYICFLKPILADVNRVNKNFESNTADPTRLLEDLMNLLNSLVSKVTTPQSRFVLFQDNIEDFFDRNCYLGYLFETQIKKMKDDGFKEEEALRERCHTFLKVLIKEVINRIPENVETLRNICTFSVSNALKHQKLDITMLLKHLNKTAEEISIIDGQWRKIHLLEWKNISDTCTFWAEVLNYKDSEQNAVFEELAMFALSLLTLPHSNAEVERLFSQMNIVKTKLRNRMGLSSLNAILTIRAGLKRQGMCCEDFVIKPDLLAKIKTSETYVSANESDDDFDIFV